jgi:hypothetical protein
MTAVPELKRINRDDSGSRVEDALWGSTQNLSPFKYRTNV